MVTHATHRHDAAHIEPVDPVRDGDESQRTSPMLIAALALALIALGVWWSAQRDAVPVPRPPVATTPAPEAAVTPATPDESPAIIPRRGSTRDSARSAERAPATAVPSYRAPQPLAGNPLPEYPPTALRSGEEGSVLLSIAIDTRGVPTDVQVIQRSGDRDRSFDRAAIEAARQWRFAPAMRGGKAVPSTVQLPVDFRRG